MTIICNLDPVLELILIYAIIFFFFIIGGIGVALSIIQLPGIWLIIGTAFFFQISYSLFFPDNPWRWSILFASLGLGVTAELFEFVSGIIGAKKGGASNQGIFGSLVGSIAGAIIGSLLIPIPVLGTLIGTLIGTFMGALVGEHQNALKKRERIHLSPAISATLGRIFGSLIKTIIGIAIFILLLLDIIC